MSVTSQYNTYEWSKKLGTYLSVLPPDGGKWAYDKRLLWIRALIGFIDMCVSIDETIEATGTEVCNSCGNEHKKVWRAPDDLWQNIYPDGNGVLCIDCFDRLHPSGNLYWECELGNFPSHNLKIALDMADTKINRQAKIITRLEQSRADLHKSREVQLAASEVKVAKLTEALREIVSHDLGNDIYDATNYELIAIAHAALSDGASQIKETE